MFDVAPTYYAEGLVARHFTIMGANLMQIPNGAIGVMSTDNDNPTMNVGNITAVNSGVYTALNNGSAQVRQDVSHTINSPAYLGAIVSADGSVIYWVNNTRPLP